MKNQKFILLIFFFTTLICNINLLHAQNIDYDTYFNAPKTEEDTIYDKALKKLIRLELKKLKSDSHIKASAAIDTFYKKLNYDDKNNMTELYTNPIPWITENIEQTSFTSVTEAELEWERCKALLYKEMEDNEEHTKFMPYVTLKFGVEILNDMNEYMMENHLDLLMGYKSPSELYKD